MVNTTGDVGHEAASPQAASVTDVAKPIVCYILAGEYGLFLIWSVVMAIVLLCRPGKIHLRKRQRFQYAIIVFLSLVRVVQWGIEPFWKTYEAADARVEAFLHGALWSLPAVCLICAYTMLVSYWIDDWFKTHAPDAEDRYRLWRIIVLVVVNVGMFIGEFVVLSLVLLFDKQTYQNVQPYYLNALYAVAVVIFGFYGFVVYRRLSHFTIASKSQQRIRNTRRILITAVIVTVTFIIRIVVNFIWPGYIHPWAFKWVFQGVFYTVIELVPIVLILWLLVERAPGRAVFQNQESQRLLSTLNLYH